MSANSARVSVRKVQRLFRGLAGSPLSSTESPVVPAIAPPTQEQIAKVESDILAAAEARKRTTHRKSQSKIDARNRTEHLRPIVNKFVRTHYPHLSRTRRKLFVDELLAEGLPVWDFRRIERVFEDTDTEQKESTFDYDDLALISNHREKQHLDVVGWEPEYDSSITETELESRIKQLPLKNQEWIASLSENEAREILYANNDVQRFGIGRGKSRRVKPEGSGADESSLKDEPKPFYVRIESNSKEPIESVQRDGRTGETVLGKQLREKGADNRDVIEDEHTQKLNAACEDKEAAASENLKRESGDPQLALNRWIQKNMPDFQETENSTGNI